MTPSSRNSSTPPLRLCLALFAALSLAGCGGNSGGGGGAPPVTPVAPSGLTYPAAGAIFVNNAMAALSPTLAAGTATSYAVAPALPAGIAIDLTTGVISGTPTAVTPLATYTITATNSLGSTPFDLDLEVLAVVIPDVDFAAGSSATPENTASVSIVVSLSAATINDVTVPVAVTGTATVGADYVAPAASITILAGQTSGTVDITLIDDLVSEGAETIVLTLGAPTGGNLGVLTVHTVTLIDDEGTPTVNFALGASSALESAGTAAIQVTLVPSSTATITATLQLVGAQTTADASDFTIANFDVTFAPGDTSQTLTVTLLDDAIFEGDEFVALNIGAAPGAAIGTVDQTVLTISEDDPEPTAEFAGITFGLLEIDPSLDLTVNLSAVSSFDATIVVATGGTADGADFTITPATLVILAGSTSGTISVTPIDDGIVEPTETIVVTLVAGSGVVIGPNGQATISLNDGPSAPCNLAYSTPAAVYGPSVAITPNVPSFQCGTPTSYAVDVPLPLGLTLDTTTGVISGTPTLEQLEMPYVITATNAIGSTDTTITIRVDLVFSLTASDAVASYDPANGSASFGIFVDLLEVASGAPAGFHEISGWSFGMRIDPAQLVVDSAMQGADSLISNGGAPATFFNVNLLADGFNCAAVIDFIQINSLIASTPKEVLSVQLSTAIPSFLLGNNSGATVTIPFDEFIGSPPADNLVVAGATGTLPILNNSTVDFIP